MLPDNTNDDDYLLGWAPMPPDRAIANFIIRIEYLLNSPTNAKYAPSVTRVRKVMS